MTARPCLLALAVLLGASSAVAAAPPLHRAHKSVHRHLVRRQPLPRPMLATVAYESAGVPYVARVPAPGLYQVEGFSTSFLGDVVLAATVPPPQPQCIPRHAVSRETQANPPWVAVGATSLYCEIVGP